MTSDDIAGDPPRSNQQNVNELEMRVDARAFVRLFQCSICSRPLRSPITLPCGNTSCKDCLPDPQQRNHVTFPAAPSRLNGITCPFDGCSKFHASDDCKINVVLLRLIDILTALAEREKSKPELAPMSFSVQPRRTSSGEDDSVNAPQDAGTHIATGGRIPAVLKLASDGMLDYESELDFVTGPDTEIEGRDQAFLREFREACLKEVDCHVCYSLMLDPTTTPCGHTFCRKCLARILDHSQLCPVCRRTLFLPSSLSRQPSNKYLARMLETLAPELVSSRRELSDSEERSTADGLDTPLFPCTLGFPGLRTFLHIFEPRYRLMIRRAVEGNGNFGMLAYNRTYEEQGRLGRVHFMQIGTMLHVERFQMLPDGRSFVECKGLHRFRVKSHGMLDGYIVADVEKLEDVSLAEEEQLEARETSVPVPADDNLLAQISRRPTNELCEVLQSFIARARQNSTRWFSNRLLETYGEPPDDPRMLPYWVAAILPLTEDEKYKILPLTSVRERLKIAVRWVHKIEAQRWNELNFIDLEELYDMMNDDDDLE